MSALRIGVDVGGTNTDAVVMRGADVLAGVKEPTSDDVLEGVLRAIRRVVDKADVDISNIDAVMIGTTHFTNALVEAKRLGRTAVLRLAGAATRAIPPMLDWPDNLRAAVDGGSFYVDGGFEFDGRVIRDLDIDQVQNVLKEVRRSGIETMAVTSVFGPVNDSHERECARIASESSANLSVSLSTEIGRLGFVERENATILNSTLRPLALDIVDAFDRAISALGVDAPLYLSQNDGTVMGSGHTRQYPVATFASGPTNSMRGAALLSGLADCAVIDIGGTTTDIGILRAGFPREAPLTVDIAGVRTNFRMPDLVSVGIGGGSIVRVGETVTVGPDSVGYELTERALVFGGSTTTATDIAVAAGLASIGDPRLVEGLDSETIALALDVIVTSISETLDRMKTSEVPIPVVLVGGGSILVGDRLPGASIVHRPEHVGVANAIGAALSQVGGQVDRVVRLEGGTREAAIDSVRKEATERCHRAGASKSTIRIVDVDEVPLAYLPSNAVRISVRAVGDLE